jgi:hypothetical protein
VGGEIKNVRDEAHGDEARERLGFMDHVGDSTNKQVSTKRVAMALSIRRHAHVTGHLGVSIFKPKTAASANHLSRRYLRQVRSYIESIRTFVYCQVHKYLSKKPRSRKIWLKGPRSPPPSRERMQIWAPFINPPRCPKNASQDRGQRMLSR